MFKKLIGTTSVLFISVFAMAGSSAFADPPHTNCNTLQATIDAASDGDVINVKGHCNGHSYVIATNGLTLRGQGIAKITGDGTAPALTITGHQVTVENFNLIDGDGDNGIVVSANGSANILDIASIKGFRSVLVIESAYANIVDSSLSNNLIGDTALVVSLGGHARLESSDVSGNNRRGIFIGNGGSMQLGSDNTINGNGEEAIMILYGLLAMTGTNNIASGNATKFLPGDNDVNCFNFSRIFIVNLFTNDGTFNFGECRLSLGATTVFTP